MSQKSIGVFDSGIGGLTIVKAIQQLLPNESIVYFGDTAHLPYGDKSPELLKKYARQITGFLKENNVKLIVIACNTASAVAKEVVIETAGDIPVVDVIQPAVKLAVETSSRKKIAVIGTKTTIASHVYREAINKLSNEAIVIEKATPLLAHLIEEGWANNTISKQVIEAYLTDTGFSDIDSIILGCTHYPLIKETVKSFFTSNYFHPISVIDSSVAVAESVKNFLDLYNLNATGNQKEMKFYVSDLTESFVRSSSIFFDQEVNLQKIKL